MRTVVFLHPFRRKRLQSQHIQGVQINKNNESWNNESWKFRKGVVAVTWWYVSVTEEAPPPIIQWHLVQEFNFFWVFLKEVFLLLLFKFGIAWRGKMEPPLAHGSRIYKNNHQELLFFFFIIVTNLNSVLEKWNTEINKKKGFAGWKDVHYLKVLTTTDK